MDATKAFGRALKRAGAPETGNGARIRLASFSEPFQKGLDRADELDEGNVLGDVLESLPACAGLATVG